jgi:hypothetical protein
MPASSIVASLNAPMAALASGAMLAVGASAATNAPTALRVTYWKSAAKATPSSTHTLRCNPPRGTLPRLVAACRKLARSGTALFAPTPPDVACTQIYGGPQKARVVGVVGRKRVWATFTRTNGCEIARWNRLVPWLLPAGRMPS